MLVVAGFTDTGLIVKVELFDTVPFVLTVTTTAPGDVRRLGTTPPIN